LAGMPVTSVLSSRDEDVLKSPYPASPPEKDDIKSTFEQIIDKIYDNSDPSKEILELLSYPEIKELIIDFSDVETLGIIETVFSEKIRVIKRQQTIKYNDKIQQERQKNIIHEFENELNVMMTSDINSLEDIENLGFIANLDITKENISNGYIEWENYLDEHPRFKSVIQENDINWELLAITLLIWGFFLTGLAAVFSESFASCIMLMEACVLGFFLGTFVGGSTGLFLTAWKTVASVGFFAFVEFLKKLSESELFSRIPNVAELLNVSYLFLGDILEVYLEYSEFIQPFLTAGTASMTTLIIFCGFVRLWNNHWIVQFFGGAAFSVIPVIGWLIISVLSEYLPSGDEIAGLDTPFYCSDNYYVSYNLLHYELS